MSDEHEGEPSGTTRRRFVQAAAAAGVLGAVWTEPVIRGSVAGAQTGVSVNGSCIGAAIEWSGAGNDVWKDGNATTFSSTGGMGVNPTGTYTWDNTAGMGSICMTLSAPVQVFATGDPAIGVGATVTLTSGASCVLDNFLIIMATVSSMLSPANGPATTFMYTDQDGAMTTISFDILC